MPDDPVFHSADQAADVDEASPPRLTEPPSVRQAQRRREQKLLLLTIRLLFIVLLVTVSLLPFVGTITDPDTQSAPSVVDFLGPFLATLALGIVVVLVDNAT
ncbi:MAG: hypothetical protein ACYTGC_16315, partial [Planctomycetota bacterium]